MSTKPNRPIGQHTVPRFYLSAFADESGKVHVLDRSTSKEWQNSPKRVSVENHFYTLPSVEGRDRFALENGILGPIETEASKCFAKLRNDRNLDAIDRKPVARFLAAQLKRTTLIGDQHLRLNDAMKDKGLVIASIERNRASLESKYGRQNLDEYIARLSVGDSLPSISNGEMMLLGQQNIDKYAKSILEMTWTLEKRKSPTFLTSDNPVYVRRRGQSHDSGLVGVLREDLGAELYFPLSPTLLLIASWRKTRQLSKFASDMRARELNRLTILCSNRQLYSIGFCDADRQLIIECGDFRLSFFDPRDLIAQMDL